MSAARPLWALVALLVGWAAATATASHIDAIAASVGRKVRHEQFVPLVAFKCGYRNKYLNTSGDWIDDPSSVATCLEGKLEILKYCKRVYPGRKITNIVEYSHISQIGGWCKENGRDCEHTFHSRPYRCIEGDFVADSLQVPSKCKFRHISGPNSCDDYPHWSEKAAAQCTKSLDEDDQKPTQLHSFAMLEPCGLGLFRGVEYVCCPKAVEESAREQTADRFKAEATKDDDEDDDEDDDDEEEEEDDEDADKKDPAEDPYFQDDTTGNEHDRFKDAQERLERRYRGKVTKVIGDWSEIFERYNRMKSKDPKGADSYKERMTEKFRQTVAALERENREQRRQLDELHDERVQSMLNERKRKATHDYRQALASQMDKANKHNVLRTLRDYIRAEEKDRAHMLNHYRHLLRTNVEAADEFEPVLLHRLRYIDLRINGTLAMLRDFPRLEKQIRPTAESFWHDYRRDNTPEIDGKLLPTEGSEEANNKLVRMLRKAEIKPTAAATTNAALEAIAASEAKPKAEELPEDSDEDQFDEDDEAEAANEEKIRKNPIVVNETAKAEAAHEFLKLKPPKATLEIEDALPKKAALKKKEELNKDDDDDDEEEEEDEEGEADDEEEDDREETAEMEVDGEKFFVHRDAQPSFARHDALVEERRSYLENPSGGWTTNVTAFGYLTVLFALTALFVFTRRYLRSRRGFVEVNVCNPDECASVNKMQMNGYENPTYAFYDSKP